MRFSEILFAITLICGAVWLLDSIFLRPRRRLYVLSGSDKQAIQDPWWVEYARSFFPILCFVCILRSFVAEPFRIPSGSMHPTLWEGDYIVVNKYEYGLKLPITGHKFLKIGEPKRGDVIVFKHDKGPESMDMIKRVVGLPNDHIQYRDKILYINGSPVKQNFLGEKLDIDARGAKSSVHEFEEILDAKKHLAYVHPHYEALYRFDDVIVPPGSYFVMGDNRDNSRDSRMWGFVLEEEIQGRAFGVVMSWNGFDEGFMNCIRWHRLFTSIQ